MKVRLTDSMVSALECREDGGLDPLVDRAWDRAGDALVFDVADAADLTSELIELCNAEDAQAEEHDDPFARKACRSLSFLVDRVSKTIPR